MSTTTNTTSGIAVAIVIWKRELIRFRRQPSRIAAAVGTPAIIWVLMGSGFNKSFSMGGAANAESLASADINYATYLLPGMMTLIAMFTAIFSSISIIEDRKEGWLQSVLVSPTPRWSIALGKVLGGATIAWVQSLSLVLMIPFVGDWPGTQAIILIAAALLLTSLAMTGVGTAFAWASESSQGFHAIMNLVLMPMWLLSGSFFPPEGATVWLRWIMYANPLTWCSRAIGLPLYDHANLGNGEFLLSFAIALVFAVGAFGVATFIISRPNRGNLS